MKIFYLDLVRKGISNGISVLLAGNLPAFDISSE
jgi:hypothetical protein